MVIDIKKISEENLEKINGGGSSAIWIGLAIAAITVFISGVIEGHLRLKWQDLKNIVFTGNSKEKRSTQIH